MNLIVVLFSKASIEIVIDLLSLEIYNILIDCNLRSELSLSQGSLVIAGTVSAILLQRKSFLVVFIGVVRHAITISTSINFI